MLWTSWRVCLRLKRDVSLLPSDEINRHVWSKICKQLWHQRERFATFDAFTGFIQHVFLICQKFFTIGNPTSANSNWPYSESIFNTSAYKILPADVIRPKQTCYSRFQFAFEKSLRMFVAKFQCLFWTSFRVFTMIEKWAIWLADLLWQPIRTCKAGLS